MNERKSRRHWLVASSITLVFAVSVAAGASPSRFPYHSHVACAKNADGAKFFRNRPALGDHAHYRIAVFLRHRETSRWQAIRAGIRDAATRFDVDVVFRKREAARAKDRPAVAQSLVDDRFNAYIVAPTQSVAMSSALGEMREQHAPIINIGDQRVAATTYVGPDYEQQGAKAAAKISQMLSSHSTLSQFFFGKRANIAQIEGDLSQTAVIQRIEGFESEVGRTDNLKLVESVAGGKTRQDAYDAAETLIRENPDLQAIYANTPNAALAAAQAADAASKTVPVVTTGAPRRAVAAVRQNVLAATVSALPYYQGYWAVESAVRLLAGKRIPAWIVVPAQLLTAHNLHLYYDANNKIKPGLYH